ncbi:MAG: hypothetical protein KDD06_29855 [Phaeodactylibacter sp.]|nr:hypothetical protein [Phaeodactylibacter sp.]MCB9266363.1 hypothetical protein [Lewinellaceae bacterium]MCB9290555.1 hypothetical protein [Lewinellaceae bacterium]
MKTSASLHPKWFLLLAGFFWLFLADCSKDNSEPVVEEPATVSGTLSLPAEAGGSTWAVIFDDDLDGDNGTKLIESGACGPGASVSYSVENVPAGKYYLYAIVYVANEFGNPPGPGDYIGVYGGDFFDNPPNQPNAVVPSTGKVTFNISLDVMPGSIAPGAWIATSEFGTFEFQVNENATYITQFFLDFDSWPCGISTFNGSMTVSSEPGWAIIDGRFEFSTDLNPDPFDPESMPMTIRGGFEGNGTLAGGDWEATVGNTDCSGTWTAAPKGG